MIKKYSYSQHDINTRVANINRFDNAILQISQSLGVDAPLIKAIIAVESSGNPQAGEGRVTGAKGLMQIIKQTWESTIQHFPNVSYRGVRLINFLDREQGNVWADPALSILVGTLTLILKGRSLTKMTGEDISPADASDAALLLTAYNAGEFTAKTAYQLAVAAGSRNPHIDFLQERHLKGAIDHVVSRFNLSWNVAAKYEEISQYAGKVLTFLDLFKGTSTYTKPNVAIETTTETTTTVNTTNNRHNTKYTIVSGDTGYRIAKKLGVTFSELTNANPNIRWNRLSVGQRLNIPVKSNFKAPVEEKKTPPPEPKVKEKRFYKYRVQRGETLGIIARKFNISVHELKSYNQSKLRRWGTVEGFEAGAWITVPA